ncbi:MAG: hypothetical protein AAF581_10415 [Planctomycetota bacterium]
MRFGHTGGFGGLTAFEKWLWVLNAAAIVSLIVAVANYSWPPPWQYLAVLVIFFGLEFLVLAWRRRRRLADTAGRRAS